MVVAAATTLAMTQPVGNTLNRRANEALHPLAPNVENKTIILAMYLLPPAVAMVEEQEEEVRQDQKNSPLWGRSTCT